MVAKNVKKTAPKVSVYGTKIGAVVTGLTAGEVRKAVRLLARTKGRVNGVDKRTKAALKFYDGAKRFFKSGDRFKKPYTRKKKK